MHRRALVACAALCFALAAPAIAESQLRQSAVPFKQTGESEDWLVYQAAGAFLLACAAAYGIAFSLKRLRPQLPGKAARHTRLQVLETRRLTQRSTLFRIDFDGQELLIAESGQSLTVLASSQPADAARYLEPGETR